MSPRKFAKAVPWGRTQSSPSPGARRPGPTHSTALPSHAYRRRPRPRRIRSRDRPSPKGQTTGTSWDPTVPQGLLAKYMRYRTINRGSSGHFYIMPRLPHGSSPGRKQSASEQGSAHPSRAHRLAIRRGPPWASPRSGLRIVINILSPAGPACHVLGRGGGVRLHPVPFLRLK